MRPGTPLGHCRVDPAPAQVTIAQFLMHCHVWRPSAMVHRSASRAYEREQARNLA